MSQVKNRSIPVAENGRMNLPADMRRAIGLTGAGRVIVSLDDDQQSVKLTTAEQANKHVRALAAPYKPSNGLASDQLIAERRQEAAQERESQRRG